MKQYRHILTSALLGFLLTLESASAASPAKENILYSADSIHSPIMSKLLPPEEQEIVWNKIQQSKTYQQFPSLIKKRIELNKGNYSDYANISPKRHVTLHDDKNRGIRLILFYSEEDPSMMIFYTRRDNFPNGQDDFVFIGKKTPALNPKTKKPWFALGKKDITSIQQKCQAKFTADDISYIKDLLARVNENFHAFYGEKLEEFEPYSCEFLSAKAHNYKLLANQAFDRFLTPKEVSKLKQSPQQLELAIKLGAPVYDLSSCIDSNIYNSIAACPMCGKYNRKLQCGQEVLITTWQVGQHMEMLKGQDVRYVQISANVKGLKQFAKAYKSLMEEQGVDVSNIKLNKSPRNLALYMIHAQVQSAIDAIVEHEYIKVAIENKMNRAAFDCEGLYKVITLPKKGPSMYASIPAIMSKVESYDPIQPADSYDDLKEKAFIMP